MLYVLSLFYVGFFVLDSLCCVLCVWFFLLPQNIAYHHAGLRQGVKKVIEDSFRDMYGLIKCIVCTTTLAQGRNRVDGCGWWWWWWCLFKLCCVLFHIDRSISFLSFTFHLLPPSPPPPPLGVNLPVTRVIIKDQYGPWNPRLNTREWLKPSIIRQMWGRAGSKFGRKRILRASRSLLHVIRDPWSHRIVHVYAV